MRWRPDEVEAVAGLGQPDVAQDDVGRLALDEAAVAVATSRGRPDDLRRLATPRSAPPGRRRCRVVLDDRDPDHCRLVARAAAAAGAWRVRPARAGSRTVIDGALADPRGGLDLAAVGGHDLAGDVQPEAQARRPVRVCRAGCTPRTSSGGPWPPRPAPWSRTTTSASPGIGLDRHLDRPGAGRVLHRRWPAG